MKLGAREFDAMQMGWRKWYIGKAELNTFRKLGLAIKGADILEAGCGSGYAAPLRVGRGEIAGLPGASDKGQDASQEEYLERFGAVGRDAATAAKGIEITSLDGI